MVKDRGRELVSGLRFDHRADRAFLARANFEDQMAADF